MNTYALKDLRDYHQRIIARQRRTIADRSKGSKKAYDEFVTELERLLLRDHERFVTALDEVLSTPTKP